MSGPKTLKKDFTIPEAEFELIRHIQSRCRKLDISLNDSEVVRAGIAALMSLGDVPFRKRVLSLVRLKRGPKNGAPKIPKTRQSHPKTLA